MDECLRKIGFQRSESDDTLYVRQQGKYLVILVMYVDDLNITGNNDDHIAQVKMKLYVGFKMTDLGLLHYYLGFEVEGQEHKVCKLIKALNGLKQAPRAWYAKMDDYLKKVGFQ